MTAAEWLSWLTLRPAASGLEAGVLSEIEAACAHLVDESGPDGAGNLVLRRHGGGQGPLLLIAAHVDQVCLWAKEILPGGFVRISAPGINPALLAGTRVRAGELLGVVGMTPPHLRRPGAEGSQPAAADLCCDLGEDEQVVGSQLRPGDPIFFASQPSGLGEGRFTGAGLDNRAGVAACLGALEQLSGQSLWPELAIVLTSSEEVGLVGAAATAASLKPDLAVAVDVTYGQGLDTPPDLSLPLGHGPAIGRGPNCHPGFERFLARAARQSSLPCQVELLPGHSGTDAWAMQVAGSGVRTATVSIPLLYMHTPVEVVALADVQWSADLLAGAVMRLDADSYQEIVTW